MTPDTFCMIYLTVCANNKDSAHMDMATCVSTYTASQATTFSGANGTIGACESYHVCNAYSMSAATHCPHASGTSLCVP